MFDTVKNSLGSNGPQRTPTLNIEWGQIDPKVTGGLSVCVWGVGEVTMVRARGVKFVCLMMWAYTRWLCANKDDTCRIGPDTSGAGHVHVAAGIFCARMNLSSRWYAHTNRRGSAACALSFILTLKCFITFLFCLTDPQTPSLRGSGPCRTSLTSARIWRTRCRVCEALSSVIGGCFLSLLSHTDVSHTTGWCHTTNKGSVCFVHEIIKNSNNLSSV